MTILITGSNGFIGSNLCNLLSNDYKILAVSRKFNIKKSNIIYFNYDMSEYSNLDCIFEEYSPDIVIHCAWMGGNSFNETNELWQTDNITFSVKLLKLCIKHKIKHFIGLGSSYEYGDQKNIFNEETICKPTNLYGITKNSFKMIAESYCNFNNIKFSWIRPVFTYGPYDVKTRLIPKVINSYLNNQDLFLNSCHTIVDYLYIDDFTNGIKTIIENELQGVYIISSNTQVEVKKLVLTIQNIMQPNCNTVFDDSIMSVGPKFICGSSSKLIMTSNWKPLYDFTKGIMNTIEYYKG